MGVDTALDNTFVKTQFLVSHEEKSPDKFLEHRATSTHSGDLSQDVYKSCNKNPPAKCVSCKDLRKGR